MGVFGIENNVYSKLAYFMSVIILYFCACDLFNQANYFKGCYYNLLWVVEATYAFLLFAMSNL